uniref:Odorant binding protein n=1 Tax=Semiothisa cinerearia TaxID=2249628 RepID=A0A889XL26_9NEOP|nr:odorant binding protein [Semiothisa cinerearia]
MNTYLVVCFAFAVAGINAGSVHLTGAQKDKAAQNVVECMKETGTKADVVAEVKKGHFTDDENIKKFTLCFFEKAGVVDHDGKLNVEAALAKLPTGVDKAEAKKLLEDCKNKKGKDAADTAYEIFKCYHAGTKTHILL